MNRIDDDAPMPASRGGTILFVRPEVVALMDSLASLRLLGLDHQRLADRYAGREMRLTDVKGMVHEGILA